MEEESWINIKKDLIKLSNPSSNEHQDCIKQLIIHFIPSLEFEKNKEEFPFNDVFDAYTCIMLELYSEAIDNEKYEDIKYIDQAFYLQFRIVFSFIENNPLYSDDERNEFLQWIGDTESYFETEKRIIIKKLTK